MFEGGFYFDAKTLTFEDIDLPSHFIGYFYLLPQGGGGKHLHQPSGLQRVWMRGTSGVLSLEIKLRNYFFNVLPYVELSLTTYGLYFSQYYT